MPGSMTGARPSPWCPTYRPSWAGTKVWPNHTALTGAAVSSSRVMSGEEGAPAIFRGSSDFWPCNNRVAGSGYGGAVMGCHHDGVGSVFQGGTLRISSICPIKATKGLSLKQRLQEVLL